MIEERPVHSPLGASSAERWMNCPGSVALIKELTLPETDEPDYRAEGTAAHEAIAKCLTQELAAWEVIGEKFKGVEINVKIADGVQCYLDEVRQLRTPNGSVFVEYGISSPVHQLFYGTLDWAQVDGDKAWFRDYKNGAGVIVEVEDNPQLMYYAYGLLQAYPDVKIVSLGIVQPNAFHPDGAVRTWDIEAEYIKDWAESTLFSAMDRTQMEGQPFDAGKWCRFCPAKLVCPLMNSLFGAACKHNPREVVALGNDDLGRSYGKIEAVKQYLKALEEEVFRRCNNGDDVQGVKLVHKKANRVWKEEAPGVFKEIAGAFDVTPRMLSPAEMEALGPDIKKLVKEYAYTPQSGLTVAPESDKRPAVKVLTSTEVFGGSING